MHGPLSRMQIPAAQPLPRGPCSCFSSELYAGSKLNLAVSRAMSLFTSQSRVELTFLQPLTTELSALVGRGSRGRHVRERHILILP